MSPSLDSDVLLPLLPIMANTAAIFPPRLHRYCIGPVVFLLKLPPELESRFSCRVSGFPSGAGEEEAREGTLRSSISPLDLSIGVPLTTFLTLSQPLSCRLPPSPPLRAFGTGLPIHGSCTPISYVHRDHEQRGQKVKIKECWAQSLTRETQRERVLTQSLIFISKSLVVKTQDERVLTQSLTVKRQCERELTQSLVVKDKVQHLQTQRLISNRQGRTVLTQGLVVKVEVQKVLVINLSNLDDGLIVQAYELGANMKSFLKNSSWFNFLRDDILPCCIPGLRSPFIFCSI
ncbi:MAG: hypothetical protein FRX49_02005 [Trebouxia sp. A1-2]|nr:MAG: hypothetical protein FRX49_02005 [Trebouxia sp. A1-2]